MNYLTLGGGAIACSAIAVYGWAHSSPPQGPNGCPSAWVENISSLLSGKATEQVQKRCLSSNLIPTITTAPEQIRSNAGQDNARSTKLPNTVEQVYRQLLEQAHTAANSDRLAEAIASAASIPKNSQHYDMAQRLQEDWSQELLQRASNCYQQADLSKAISMLSAIPQRSQRYARANELHTRWNKQAILLNQAIAAREVGNWRGVMNAVKALEGTQLYQSAEVQELLQQATSRAFEPDETLLQLAAGRSANPSSVSLPPEINYTTASLPMDPPQPSNLSIGIEQALEWARPPAQSSLALPSKAPKRENVTGPLANSPMGKSSIPVSQ